MNWSYLHFKNHVEVILYDDTDKEFHSFDKRKRGGPLFFKLLTNSVLSANEKSLAALESTIKVYNIASDGKDDVPEAIKVLKAGAKTIQAMREGGSGKYPLPDKFVVGMITVYCTTSVDMFNKKMEAYQGSLESAELVDDETNKINTPIILQKVFTMAVKYHKQLFDAGIWESQVLAIAKLSFTAVTGRNLRCWNCDKESCSMNRCNQPINLSTKKNVTVKSTSKLKETQECCITMIKQELIEQDQEENDANFLNGVLPNLLKITNELSMEYLILGMDVNPG
jgi:hypothetical protein